MLGATFTHIGRFSASAKERKYQATSSCTTSSWKNMTRVLCQICGQEGRRSKQLSSDLVTSAAREMFKIIVWMLIYVLNSILWRLHWIYPIWLPFYLRVSAFLGVAPSPHSQLDDDIQNTIASLCSHYELCILLLSHRIMHVKWGFVVLWRCCVNFGIPSWYEQSELTFHILYQRAHTH